MADMTTYSLSFVLADSFSEGQPNGNPAGVRKWAPGTCVRAMVTVPDNDDGTLDEFAAESAGREKLRQRGVADEDYSLEEVEIMDRFEAGA